MAGNPKKLSPRTTRAATADRGFGGACGEPESEPDPHPVAAISTDAVVARTKVRWGRSARMRGLKPSTCPLSTVRACCGRGPRVGAFVVFGTTCGWRYSPDSRD